LQLNTNEVKDSIQNNIANNNNPILTNIEEEK